MNHSRTTETTQADLIFPFGKFRNRPISRVPSWYLTWAKTITKSRDLAVAIGVELDRRASRATLGPRARPAPGGHSGAGRPFWLLPGETVDF